MYVSNKGISYFVYKQTLNHVIKYLDISHLTKYSNVVHCSCNKKITYQELNQILFRAYWKKYRVPSTVNMSKLYSKALSNYLHFCQYVENISKTF